MQIKKCKLGKMPFSSWTKDGFSFISHSDSIEEELPLAVYMGPPRIRICLHGYRCDRPHTQGVPLFTFTIVSTP